MLNLDDCEIGQKVWVIKDGFGVRPPKALRAEVIQKVRSEDSGGITVTLEMHREDGTRLSTSNCEVVYRTKEDAVPSIQNKYKAKLIQDANNYWYAIKNLKEEIRRLRRDLKEQEKEMKKRVDKLKQLK